MNFDTSLEKFMDTMGINYEIKIDRNYWSNGHAVCAKIMVYYKSEPQYIQYHCYSKRRDGQLKYEEGNEVKGIQQGVLAYLGNDRAVDNYFDNLARIKVSKYLQQNA